MGIPRRSRISTAVTALVAAAFSAAAPEGRAQSVANGSTLYNTYCRACHGMPPAGGPERARGAPAVIRNAISGRVPAMGFLAFLGDASLADIAAYLASLSAPAPEPPPRPAFDVTDLWWNEAEPGWGLNLIQHESDIVFGVLYAYEAPGRPEWLVLPSGTWSDAHTYAGTVYRVTGPAADGPFDPAAVDLRPFGTATLAFTDRDHGVFTLRSDGVETVRAITRQPF